MRPLISRLFVTFYVMMMLTVTNASFVIGNGSRTATVACQSEVKKVCSVPVNTIFVDWAIDYTDDPQTLVASCSRSSGCNTFHNFSSRYSFSYDSTKGISNLTINPVLREDDNRKYKCSDGSTEPMTLYVQVLPERNGTQVTSHRKQNEVVLKANTSCVYPVATVNMTWLYRTKNGSRFVDQNGAVPVILSCQSSSDGCVNSTNDKMLNSFLNFSTAENGEWREYSLEISYLPVSKNDIGVYEVTVGQFNVTNTVRSTTSKQPPEKSCLVCIVIPVISISVLIISVAVFITKEPVTRVTVLSRFADHNKMTVQLQWKARLVRYKKFVLQYENLSDSRQARTIFCDNIDFKTNLMSCDLKDLTLDADYQVHIYSTMCRVRSFPKTIELDTKGKPNVPTFLQEDKSLRTDTTITIRWNRDTSSGQHYVLKYKRCKAKKNKWFTSGEIKSNCYVLQKLKPATNYVIVIYAQNSIGRSDDSEPLIVKTKASNPEPPADFSCTNIAEDKVTLSWRPSRNTFKQTFILSVESTTRREISIGYDRREIMEYTVTDLQPATEYLFEIITLVGRKTCFCSTVLRIKTKGSQVFSAQEELKTSVFMINTNHR